MRQMWAALLSLASMVIAPVLPALAQDASAPPIDAGVATYDGGASISGFASAGLIDGSYLYFRKDFDNGVGYQDGFSTVGGFVPLMTFENQGFFVQGQLFVTDAGDTGGNLGGGYRYYVESIDRVLSAHGFYDNDKSFHANRNEQLGIGVETLGPMWDFRANAYLPLDDESRFFGVNQLVGPPAFAGNGVFVNGTGFFEKTMGGGDFEFGFPLLDPSAFGRLRMYVGGYGYDGEKQDQAGVRGRLEAHINQHATVGAAFMHDDVNGEMITMSVDLRGWSRRLPEMNNRNVSNRPKMFLPVVRQYRIAHETYVDDITTPALGPGGDPLNIVWVDNSNTGGGSGTFEDPFTALPGSASGADYILVRRGDSTLVNPVLGGITLEDGQRLFGEGFTFNLTLTGTVFGPQFAGNYSIQSLLPQWDISGNHPFVSNPGGNVVTLANNNEVGGLNIVSSAGHGITGTGINNFRLFDLNLGSPGFGNGGAGVLLTNATGVGSIENFTAHGNTGGGVIVSNTGAAALTIDIEAQQFDDPNVTGGAVGVRVLADNSTITANITNVRNTGSGIGLDLGASNGGVLTADVDEGRFDDATGDGIQATVNNATLAMTLNNITGNNAGGNGLDINIANGGVFQGTIGGDALGDASFSDGTGNGINVLVDNSPSTLGFLVFNNTTADGNGLDGLHVELTNSSLFDIAFTDGTISGNVGDNVDTDVDGGSTLDILIDPTDLSGAGQNGYRFNVVNGSTLNATFDLVALNNNGDNGILGTLDTAGVANLNFTQISVNGNGEHGMFVTALGGSTFNGDFVQAGFNGNNTTSGGFDGINFVADAATINFDLTDSFAGNTGGGNQDSGLHFLVQNAGATDINILRSNLTLNDGEGVLGEVHGAGSTGDISISASTLSDNGDNGTHLIVDTGASLIATVSAASTMSNNGQNGFLLDANDAGTTASVTMSTNNQFNSNGDAGVRINATDIDELVAIVSGSASDNSEEGVEFNVDNVADAAMAVTGSGTVSDNGLDGIQVNVTNGTTITGLVTQGASASGNSLNGIQVNIDNSTIAAGGGPLNPTVQIGGGSIDDNGSNGIELNLDTVTAAVDSVRVGGSSSISDNGDNGIHVDLLNTPLDGLQIVNNFNVSGNGAHGLRVDLIGSDLTNLNVSGNSFDGNTDAGVEFFGDSDVSGTFDGNSMSDNGQEGVAINLDNAETFTATFTGNDISGNAGGGLIVNAEDNAQFDLTVGTAGIGNGNTFDGNGGAGLGLRLIDDAIGDIGIENSSFTNTTVGTNPNFSGQGVQISVANGAQIAATAYVRSSRFTDNAAAGLRVVASGDDFLSFARIQGMTVGGATIADGNLFQDNGGNGLEFIRTGNGQIGLASAIVIQNNLFDNNSGNGFLLDAAGTPLFTDRYVVNQNVSQNNTLSGAQLFVRADGSLDVDMDQNVFDSNDVDGVTLSEQVNNAADQRFATGVWTRNEFTDNGQHGIGMGSNVSGLMIGDLASDALGNTIALNNNDGISVTGPGQFTIARNLITQNGSNTAGAGDNDAGIDIHSSTFLDLTIFNNDIVNNRGDGIENETDGPFIVSLDIQNNFIAFNDGRGFDLLVQPNDSTHDSLTDVEFHNNVVNENGEEGVYVIFTSSHTQTQDVASTTALLADGHVNDFFDGPQLRFDMTGNQIVANGSSSGFTATGLVVRVGTSGSGSNFGAPFNTSDFVSDGVSVNSAFQNTGVIMQVANNSFGGNFGDDIYFDSFTSTEDPLVTAGTWSNALFEIDDIRGDPLARLDLHWSNNLSDSNSVTNIGAFYDTAEGTFKSRTVDATDPGPFGTLSAARNRNAQRIASRVTGVTNPVTPGGVSDQYLYPGTGPSSFRVRGALGDVLGSGFALDTAPYNDIGDANGIFRASPLFEMPYGWTYLGP